MRTDDVSDVDVAASIDQFAAESVQIILAKARGFEPVIDQSVAIRCCPPP